MRSYQPFLILALATSAALVSSGCLAFDPGQGEELGAAEQPIITTNALTTAALTTNTLTSNSVATDALTSQPLTTDALASNPPVLGALADAMTRELFFYIVSCALPLGAHVDVTVDGATYGFDGQIGLVPQWGNAGGSCDGPCKEWVSACVLSRVNYLGLTMSISARGNKPALALSDTEATDYPHREAAYFGNIFTQPPIRFACLPSGKVSIPRVCGLSIDACAMDVIGTCDTLCASAHPATGAYPHCREDPLSPCYPAITIYLK